MPELPEVETVRTGLEAALKGAVIEEVQLRRGNLRIPFPEGFAEKLEGRTIKAIQRRAKYLLFMLDSKDVLLAHLGMSGVFFVDKERTAKAHDHVIFRLRDGRIVTYNDARRFGLMTIVTQKELAIHPLLADLGPEPFSEEFSPAYLKQALTKRSSSIKPVLMDQAVVVGVGNIYACEALFLARIDPRHPANAMTGKSATLIKSIRQVLTAAIESGGSSLRDFLHVTGYRGDFQHRFQVYGRAGKPCFHCKTPVETLRQTGRTTFFCQHCQR